MLRDHTTCYVNTQQDSDCSNASTHTINEIASNIRFYET